MCFFSYLQAVLPKTGYCRLARGTQVNSPSYWNIFFPQFFSLFPTKGTFSPEHVFGLVERLLDRICYESIMSILCQFTIFSGLIFVGCKCNSGSHNYHLNLC